MEFKRPKNCRFQFFKIFIKGRDGVEHNTCVPFVGKTFCYASPVYNSFVFSLNIFYCLLTKGLGYKYQQH